ncbi:MAG: hypothetical protein E6K81_03235 [Candidatus Eisenbacteria bacterium]|uniref:Uncharacterized protein n=1 Tax=Eiseniibacteriota bacterium TaxID=2212470 RepID=A0A538UCU6_UNCEI|nr:MAG: hypothetical protein E6K81_03235 [Candidatus Eisenbacteria bacterium]
MIPLATPPTPGPPTAHARGTATSARCLGLALAGLQLLAARPAPGTDWSAGADLGWRAARVARDPAATAWNANHETFVAPRMRVSLDGNDTRLVVAARQEAFLRRSIDGRPRLTLPRLGAGVADLRWVRTGPLGSTRGYGRYARSTTPLDVAAPVTSVPGGYATWSTGARVALGPLEGAGRFDGWSYQDPRLADAHELAWEATARPLRTARSAGLVGWRHRTVGSAHTTLRSDLVVAGFRRALAPALAAQIEVGGAEAVLGSAPPRRGPALVVSLSGPDADSGPVQASCTVVPGLPVEVTAAGERSLGDVRWSVRWESRLDAEGGWRRPPSLVRRLALGAEDTLGRANVVGAEVSAARLLSMFPPASRTDALRVSGWLVRRMRPWLSLRLDYAQVAETSGTPSRLGAPDRYRLGASPAMVR